MEIYLISNNLLENNIAYSDKSNLEKIKMTRPLSIEGETAARDTSLIQDLNGTTLIYASMHASAIGAAKYLADRLDKKVVVDSAFNDCLIGELGTKSLKMIRFMQNHDFNIKLNNGESLDEVGTRMEKALSKVIYLNGNKKVAIFTHRRALLGLLIKLGKAEYNLDDDIVIEYNDKMIYDDAERDVDVIKLIVDNKKVVDMEAIEI